MRKNIVSLSMLMFACGNPNISSANLERNASHDMKCTNIRIEGGRWVPSSIDRCENETEICFFYNNELSCILK